MVRPLILALSLAALIHACAPKVAPDTMRAIVSVESGGNPHALNDNTTGTRYCTRSSCSKDEAVRIADALIGAGHSVDIGLSQVNSRNFPGLGVTAEQMLEPCANLRAGSLILARAYQGSAAHYADQGQALYHALQAYNSGNRDGAPRYARLVIAAATPSSDAPVVPSIALLTQNTPRHPEARQWARTVVVRRHPERGFSRSTVAVLTQHSSFGGW